MSLLLCPPELSIMSPCIKPFAYHPECSLSYVTQSRSYVTQSRLYVTQSRLYVTLSEVEGS